MGGIWGGAACCVAQPIRVVAESDIRIQAAIFCLRDTINTLHPRLYITKAYPLTLLIWFESPVSGSWPGWRKWDPRRMLPQRLGYSDSPEQIFGHQWRLMRIGH